MITQEIRDSIDESVLCWLATADRNGVPNCSPKEAFTYYGDDKVIIANIASPGSIRNISDNAAVCVSFINVFTQKGFKLKGQATYLTREDPEYQTCNALLSPIVGNAFPVKGVVVVSVTESASVVAPSYYMIPGTTVEDKIRQSMETYGVKR
jgi:predicted pyridoxine 5'-phosphate oxidase superfamily flavin-nucleotide-binding protein